MGILREMFSPANPPVITSMLPINVQQLMMTSGLQNLNVDNIMLKQNEICHYAEKACLVTEKTIRRTKRTYGGPSIRIAKGLTYHTGTSYSTPIESVIPVYTKGYLYVTNQRIIFSSQEKGFDKSLDKLTTYKAYSDAFGFQFGEKVYNVLIPTSNVLLSVFNYIQK